MKLTLSWLRTHLDTTATVQELTDALTRIGLEVEGVSDPGAALAPFRVARVVEAVQHPNADRLRACTVDVGGELVGVVCGAPNARAGLVTVFAPPGSVIPGTGAVLKVGEIRGVQSAGMLLSLREMGLGESHDGIVELPEDAPVGQSYGAWAGLDDPVIEIGVTPNRGDALGVRGIARDLAAAGLGVLRPWGAAPVAGAFASPLGWAIEAPEACPWVLGRVVRGLRNGPSPAWLQARLRSVGLRPISALVDVTNFFTLDLGRPLHVFDADRVQGATLTIRTGRAGETLAALNGRSYGVEPDDCVIADARGVVSLAGVMGGEPTGATADTTSVFIECALFDPVHVALTGRRLQLASDARQRFERGIDPALPPAALEAATRMILELCGGEAGEVVQAGAEPAWAREATLRFERLAGLGGLAVPPDEAAAVLDRLGFATRGRDGASITVAVPSWRNDVAQGAAPAAIRPDLEPAARTALAEAAATVEAECDLIEEVLRIHGLDAVPPVSLPRAAPVPLPTLTPRQARTALARRLLAARGLAECVTFAFTDQATARLFGGGETGLRLLNPIASDLDQMRPTPLTTLALAAGRNAARGLGDVGLFEAGPGYALPAPGPGQALLAAGLRLGRTPRHWAAPARDWDAMDAKADALALLAALGLPMDSLAVTADAPAHYHPGRSGVVRQGPRTVLARFGALHPAVLAALGLEGACVGFEVMLDAVPEPKRRRRAAPELPALQPVRRDFAFLVGPDVAAEAVLRAARGAERTLVAGVSLFDVYAGEPLAPGQRSLGVEVVFQPREHTLTDAELEAASAKVVAAVAKATGAVLR